MASTRPSLDAASAAIRTAVRSTLGPGPGSAAPSVIVAVSGGADSLALLSACAFLHRRGELVARTVTVDHDLQAGSAEVAARVRAASESWGVPAEVVRVSISVGADGLEAAARHARYAALEQARVRCGASAVLTAHTRSDQAETVLLGLLRGSGTRSLAGMAARTASYRLGTVVRPLLGLDRALTEASCAAQGIEVWNDPMNTDVAYSRVRVRSLLARLESELGRPITANLARTADLARADADCLDELAAQVSVDLLGRPMLSLDFVDTLAGHPDALLTRALRSWLLSLDVPAQEFGVERVAEIATMVRNGGTRRWDRSPRRLSLPRGNEIALTRVGLVFRSATILDEEGITIASGGTT